MQVSQLVKYSGPSFVPAVIKRSGSPCPRHGQLLQLHEPRSIPEILAPADSPSDEQLTLGDVAAELELEPRRANLLGAFHNHARCERVGEGALGLLEGR